jgi:UDPglucose 6-dehydrogenase
MCERLPGGDVDVVTDAIGQDCRIGHKYLKGGLGFGGPCFPRDNIALNAFSETIGIDAMVARATDSFNRAQTDRLAIRLAALLPPGGTVAILGLAYKPFSHVVEESHSIKLALALADAGIRVTAYDPLARETAQLELKDKAVVLDDLRNCINSADLVVVATPDPVFEELSAEDFPARDPKVTVYDCWRHLASKLERAEHIRYLALGRAEDVGTSGDASA